MSTREILGAKTYRQKHTLEALRWTNTDESREQFAKWFARCGILFETRGPEMVLPGELEPGLRGLISAGDWILYSSAREGFFAMSDELFTETYETVP
jgi:hypothetical protein